MAWRGGAGEGLGGAVEQGNAGPAVAGGLLAKKENGGWVGLRGKENEGEEAETGWAERRREWCAAQKEKRIWHFSLKFRNSNFEIDSNGGMEGLTPIKSEMRIRKIIHFSNSFYLFKKL